MQRNKLIFLSFLVYALTLFSSCRNKVIINRNFIYSTSWSRGEYQGFRIAKIKLVESNVSVFDKKFTRYQLEKYIIDSSFCYGIVSTEYSRNQKDKIYFDKPNKNIHWYKCINGYDRVDLVGQLRLDTWYIILGLSGAEDFYVYIDNEGASHVYSLGPENW